MHRWDWKFEGSSNAEDLLEKTDGLVRRFAIEIYGEGHAILATGIIELSPFDAWVVIIDSTSGLHLHSLQDFTAATGDHVFLNLNIPH